MKFIPILMSTTMVEALLDLRKTMTRRTKGLEEVNENPDDWEFVRLANGYAKFCEKHNWINERHIKCPYGQPGDVFWVRETWGFHSGPGIYGGNYTAPSKRPGREGWKESITHKAGNENNAWGMYGEPKWKPNIHMPKTACRTFLEITKVKVERLKSITNAEAFAEGIEWIIKYPDEEPDLKYYRDYLFKNRFAAGILFEAKHSFFSLWCKINGKESLDANPWVWVVSFKQINKPSNFLP